jgi:RNA polymerase sigma factor (sigma-70 family)
MEDPSLMISAPLLHAAQQGDEAACTEVIVASYPLIARHVRSQIRRRADVEDVIQEVIMKIALKLHQYHGPQPFEHWLSRIAITTAYDWLRKQKSRPAVSAGDLSEQELGALEHALAEKGGADHSLRQDLLGGLLDKLIAMLHPREQVVIRMLDLEERPVREIADLTGWSESKIKVTAHRSRKKLAEILNQLEQP